MDQHVEDATAAGAAAPAGSFAAGSRDTVVGVHLYPVKSCQAATLEGAPLRALDVGPTGLRVGDVVDRGWVLAGDDQAFVTQRGWDDRQHRRHRQDRLLASVAVDIRLDHLHLGAPGHGELAVSLADAPGLPAMVRAFESDLPVTDEGPAAAAFFSELLGRPVRLTRVNLARPRWLAEQYRRPGAANRSAAADGRPLSLASRASLDYLHQLAGLVPGRLPMDRFRSNIEIEGDGFGPFGEDRLRMVRLGGADAHVVQALVRCPVPNIDQRTGDDQERLATRLLRPRAGWATGEEYTKPAGPFFGQSLNHAWVPDVETLVAVGDPVVALGVGEPNVVLKR